MQLARHDGQIGHDDQLHHTRHGLAGLRGDSTTFSSCPSSPGGCAPTPQAPGGEGRRVVSGAARSRGECEDKDRDDEIDRHGERVSSDETVRRDETSSLHNLRGRFADVRLYMDRAYHGESTFIRPMFLRGLFIWL